jgi:hypothetical protein
MDDVRQSVRESGEVLARSVKGLTISPLRSKSGVAPLRPYINWRRQSGNLGDQLTRAAPSTSLRFSRDDNGTRAKVSRGCWTRALPVLSALSRSSALATLEPVLPEPGSARYGTGHERNTACSTFNYFQVRAAGRDSSEDGRPPGTRTNPICAKRADRPSTQIGVSSSMVPSCRSSHSTVASGPNSTRPCVAVLVLRLVRRRRQRFVTFTRVHLLSISRRFFHQPNVRLPRHCILQAKEKEELLRETR